MKAVKYFGLQACYAYGFPYIYDELAEAEQAPQYESEPSGIAELKKVLEFVRINDYYPTFEEKSAYLFSSIAGSQYFSNGNKRLAVTVLLMFLMHNDVLVLDAYENLKELLIKHFPRHVWEENMSIDGHHSLFLYNLAIVIGDRTQWGADDLSQVRKKIAEMFSVVHAFSVP